MSHGAIKMSLNQSRAPWSFPAPGWEVSTLPALWARAARGRWDTGGSLCQRLTGKEKSLWALWLLFARALRAVMSFSTPPSLIPWKHAPQKHPALANLVYGGDTTALASAPRSTPSEQPCVKGWSADPCTSTCKSLFFPLVFFSSSLPSFALRKHLFPDVVLESNKRSERPWVNIFTIAGDVGC